MRTTIQVSSEVRKKLKVLAALRDLTYEDLIKEMLEAYESKLKKNENT